MSDGNRYLDQLPVYVVSVESFVDRHALIRQQAAQHGLNVDFIWSFDAEHLTDQERSMCVEGALPVKSMSCVLKHVEAQRCLVSTSHDIALILEDDALLNDDFAVKLRSTIDLANNLSGPWLIFLGGMDNELDARFFESAEFRLIESPLTTAEAYLVNRQGCLARLDWLSKNLISLPADHFIKHLDQSLNIPHFRVSDPFVTQGSITGLFTTALDASRAKKPSWYLSTRFRWNRFRKQTLPKFCFGIVARARRFLGNKR